MNILVIGRDPALFQKNSPTADRIREYATLFDEYHVVVMMPRGFSPYALANGSVIPTNSLLLPFAWLDAVRIGRKIIRRHTIDVIDAQDTGESGLAACIVSWMTGVPFRLQIHTDIMSPWYRRASWKEWIRYWLARFLIPRARCIRVVSQRIKQLLLQPITYKLQPKTVMVLPIFTDISKFLAAAPDTETERRFQNYDFKMVAVGRFVEKEKNFSMLIVLMRDFVKICPRAVLVLVGGGQDKKSYELRIKNYGLAKNVVLEPWRNDLPSFLKSFDVFLLSSNYEGWGRVIIEAISSGLPVVTTDVGLAGEIVKNGENGVVVPVGDREKFFQAVRDLYEHPEKRKIFAAAGFATVRNITLKNNEEYLRAYRDSFDTCVISSARSS